MFTRLADRALEWLIKSTSAKAGICDGKCVFYRCEYYHFDCPSDGFFKTVYRCQLPDCSYYLYKTCKFC